MKRTSWLVVVLASALWLISSMAVLAQDQQGAKDEAQTTAQASQPAAPAGDDKVAKEELTGEAKIVVDMVEAAIGKFQEKGKDYALKLLNASMGPFRKGSLYVFAADFEGVNLAHPARRDLVGKNAWKLKGAKGKFLVQEMIKVAKDPGEGWVEYWWNRTGESDPVLKRAFVKRVPGEDVWLGSAYIVEGK